MSDPKITETIATYDAIAHDYAQARSDRRVVGDAAARFVACVPAGGTVLDVGCGPGFDTAVLNTHHLHAIGLDLSLGMLQAGRTTLGLDVAVAQADMRRLPIGTASVDGIWALASLLHLPATAVAPTLLEFRRVLRPGGALYLSVKQRESHGRGAEWTPNAYGHNRSRYFRFWTPTELDAALTDARFTVRERWQTGIWLNRIATSPT